MALEQAAAMLQSYNNTNKVTENRKGIDSRANQVNKFASSSYANPYDYYADQFNNTQNFKNELWQTAFELGEQDELIALLNANKDRTLSKEYYDDMYYDYQTSMLELKLPFLDNEKEQERFENQFNSETGEWEEVSIGDMTEQQYVAYVLEQQRKARAKEIKFTAEKLRKDNMSWWAKFGNTVLATAAEFGEGVLGALISLVETVAYSPWYIGGTLQNVFTGNDDLLESYVNYMAEDSLTAMEKEDIRAQLDEWERTSTFMRDIDGSITWAGKYFGGIANSIGMMIPAIVANAVTGGSASLAGTAFAKVVGTGTFYASIFSSNIVENRQANPDAAPLTVVGNAALKTAAEALIEVTLDKVLGGTIGNRLLGLSGKSVGVKTAAAALSKAAGWRYLAKSALQEGAEEFLQDFSTNCIDAFTQLIDEGWEYEGVTFQTLVDSFLVGAASSIVMGFGRVGVNKINSIRSEGMTDRYIETTKGELKKIGGLKRLAFDDMLNSLQADIETLMSEKVVPGKNIELAEEVYGVLSFLSEYYKGFDAQRIKNSERLLARVREIEQDSWHEYSEQNQRAAMILTEEDFKATANKSIDMLTRNKQRQVLNDLANSYKSDLRDMLSSAIGTKQLKVIEESADKIKEKLAEAGVRQIKAATNKNGETYTRDPDIVNLEKQLKESSKAYKKKKAAKKKQTNAERNADPVKNRISKTLEELSKEYDWVFTTDGHIAVQIDGMVYVPEAWLRNYKKSEIYRYLQQDKVLSRIIGSDRFAPFLKKLVQEYSEFSGIKNVTREQALINFLFDTNTYTYFLLKNNGSNLHNFMSNVFNIYKLIDNILQENDSAEGKNYIKQIKERIRRAMRPATLKAVLNWNLDPQEVGADAILIADERVFVNLYQQKQERAKRALKPGKVSNEYAEDAEILIKKAKCFDKRDEAWLRRGLAPDATNDERLMTVAALNIADVIYEGVDYVGLYAVETKRKKLADIVVKTLSNVDNIDWHHTEDFFEAMIAITRDNKELRDIAMDWYEEEFTYPTFRAFVNDNSANLKKIFDIAKDILATPLSEAPRKRNDLLFLNMSAQACADFGVEGIETTQAKNDAINTFIKEYGIDPDKFLKGFPPSAEYVKKIKKEKAAMGITSNVDFVIAKLEQLLGDEYVITPLYDESLANKSMLERFLKFTELARQSGISTNEATNMYNYQNEMLDSFVDNYVIIRKVPANKILRASLFEGTIEEQNRRIRDMLSNGPISLMDILGIIITDNVKLKSILSHYKIRLSSLKGYSGGYFQQRFNSFANGEIVLNSNGNRNLLQVLTHELNHLLQYEYFMTDGFNSETAINMPDYMFYVYNKYKELSKWWLRITTSDLNDLPEEINEDILSQYSPSKVMKFKSLMAELCYRLMQGELWGETHINNGKLVKSFTKKKIGDSIVVIPPKGDGNLGTATNISRLQFNTDVPLGPQAEEALLLQTFENVLTATRTGKGKNNTYHTRATRPAAEVITPLLRENIDPVTQSMVTIDDIIRDPQAYLRKDLAEHTKNMTEGQVYQFLKGYIEQTHKGLSLDRNNSTHQYLVVDDNSFDDLLTDTARKQANDTKGTDLQESLKDKPTTLDKFYSQEQLDKLGVPGDIVVIVSSNPKAKNEFIVNAKYPDGAIVICYTNGRNNADFLDRVNHEFRHLMQQYNRFEGGFTTDFTVTKDMLKDIKKHVPNLFTEARRLYPDMSLTDAEIAQRFIYYLVGGEQQAFGIDFSLILSKPAYVSFEAGKVKIFMPWYDAKTGEGMYDTDFAANKYEDEAEAWLNAHDPERIKAAEEKRLLAEARKAIAESKKAEREVKALEKQTLAMPPEERQEKIAKAKENAKAKKQKAIETATAVKEKVESGEEWLKKHEPKKRKKTEKTEEKTEEKTTFGKKKQGIEKLPEVDKQRKYTKKVIYYINNETNEVVGSKTIIPGEKEPIIVGNINVNMDTHHTTSNYQYDKSEDNSRKFSYEKAKGTNLEYFYKKNGSNEMDPNLQDFVIATTGHEKELPAEIVYSIKRGKLTRQKLFEWFRNVDAKEINQFTFDLINDSFFHNEAIENMTELEKITTVDPALFYAIAVVLRSEGLSLASLVEENDVDSFLKFINGVENSKWARKIANQSLKFNKFRIENKTTGNLKGVEIELANETAQWARVLMMQYYDGTLAGAFYGARAIRRVMRDYQNRDDNIVGSLDKEMKDGEEKTFGDAFSTENGYRGEYAEAAQDIIGMYEEEVVEMNRSAVIHALAKRQENYYWRQAEKKAKNRTFKSPSEKKALIEQSVERATSEFRTKLEGMTDTELALRYNYIRDAVNTGVEPTVTLDDGTEIPRKKYVQVRANLRRYATQLLNLVNNGKVVWKLLPEDVQDMFETVTATDENGKKYQVRKLKEETYLVGRGGQKVKDITFAQRNEERLKAVWRDAKRGVYQNKDVIKRVQQLETERERRIARDVADLKKSKGNVKASDDVKTTEFTISKKKKKGSDTPNVFTIISAVDMPDIVKKLFDTSFSDMADTKVQFASVDEAGNKYVRGDKEFDSRLQHEISNWDTFYAINREALMNMTRQEMLDTVEFIQTGASTLNGPVNKLYAFQVFLLGYIIDAGRRNTNNWNMSKDELAIVEQVYERLASAYGSGLQAVRQMLDTINPLKKIQQRMLDEYNITELEAEPLYDAIEALQEARTYEERKERAAIVADEMKRIEDLFVEKSLRPTGFGKRWYEKMKSARYTFMLSSPLTWIRNQVSNVVNLVFNKAADAIGNIGMPKDSYKRDDQWNLAKVKTSDEVKAFIDREIKDNPVFEDLFEGTNKYDYRGKERTREQQLFISLIVQSLERKYAANHRFDSATANRIANWVNDRISDKRFIKFAATRYFGKILTIEHAKGNVSLNRGLTNNVLNLFAESIIAANYDYMRRRSVLADWIDALYDKHRTLYEVLYWFQPFLNSSFNWFQEMLKYTPAGLIRAIYNMTHIEQVSDKLAKRRSRGETIIDKRMAEFYARRDLGKGVIGMLMIGLGLILALTGVMKLDEDDDKFYITIGNVKVDISNIFASSSILVGASLGQLGSKDIGDILGFIFDTYTEGFLWKDIMERHRWDQNMYEAMLTETESILRSFVPQFVQLFIRAFSNKKIKYSNGMKGMWERWLNAWIPTQPMGEVYIDPYTGDVQTKYALPFVGELLKGGMLGPSILWERPSEMEEYANSLGIKKGAITAKITVDGTEKELNWYEVNKKYGELNAKSLNDLKTQSHTVKMPDGSFSTLKWSAMSDTQRANVIDRTMTQNSTIAKIWAWTKDGHKYYADDSLYKRLRSAGITKNVYLGDKGFVV